MKNKFPVLFIGVMLFIVCSKGNAQSANTTLSNLVSPTAGSIKVDGSTLSSAAYQYSLYVNGRLVDTKQMILTK